MRKLILLLALTSTFSAAAAPSASAPASISKEGDLVIVKLTPDAEKRLRLKVATVEERAMPEVRLFAGEVVVPSGDAKEPMAPVVGGSFEQVLQLAERQASADGRIKEAEIRIELAKLTLERALQARKAEAESAQAVDAAKAALQIAEAGLAVAEAQRRLLGTPMGQIASSSRAWIRVPIYTGESGLLDEEADAAVSMLGASTKALAAKPVSGPPTANAVAGTIDRYYELPQGTRLQRGARVAVEIRVRGAETPSLVVPFNAVLHDIHGGEWVYERTSEHNYTRRRVRVKRVAQGQAVLASGPPPRSRIVTDGAAELFGTEFYTGR